ncbi:MAG TPA: hypothetical protein VGN42_17315 [Pirellulales bacterium]|nr:hypothetical protein [Pirellulales bacterium]
MAEAFDPYHKWLGISPKDQPPNHYRLLGIELFESDPDVIEGAADQRMAHLRTFQTGQNSALSQRILNELSAAKVCLFDRERKAEYDRQLQAKLLTSTKSGGADPPRAEPLAIPEPAPIVIAQSASPVLAAHKRAKRKSPAWRQPAALACAGVAALALIAAIYALSSSPKADVAAANRARPASAKIEKDVAKANSGRRQLDPAKSVKTVAATAGPSAPFEAPPGPANADFEIINASWGAGETQVDVTDGVRKQVKNDRLLTMVWGNLFGSPQDPAPGAQKKLRIQYRARGRVYALEYPEFSFVYLDGNPLASPTAAADGLELLEARYGAGDTYLDVLPEARERVRDGRFSVAEDEFYKVEVVPEGWDAGMWANAFKVLWVRYRSATGEHFAYAWNSQLLTIDCRPQQTAGSPVDLLQLIDVKRDAVQGDWKLDGRGLLAPGEKYDRLQLPADAPDEYVLTVVVEAEGELRDVSAGLRIGGRQVLCCLDGDKGSASGLNKVNNAWFNQPDKNPTFSWRMSRLLEQGRPNMLTYIVRKTSLRVLRDGAEMMKWSGDPRTLSLSPNYEVRDPRNLFLQSYDMPFRVTKLELAPLGPAKSEMLVRPEPNQPVDLLAAIDLDRDAVHGDWRLDGPALVSPGDRRRALQLPAVLPESYRLEVAAARESGNDCLSFTLPVGGVQTSLVIDGYQGKLSGLQTIDGKDIEHNGENETRREASIFADGQPKAIAITVRKNRVQMACDGRQLVDWTGDVKRLAPTEKLPYKDRIYLDDWYSRYRITKIVLTPLSADHEADSPPVLAGEPVDVLKQINLQRDAVKGDWQLIDGVLVTPEEEFSRLMLPAPPSPEYRLIVVAERVKGNWGLATGLVVGGRQVVAGIDCFDGYHSGLELLDDKGSSDNETTLNGRLLVDGRPSTLAYTVRRNGIEVSLDGRTVIDWHGDPKRLSMIEEWKIPDSARLSLNTFKTVCRISKIELAPLTSEPATGPSAPSGLLKIFEDEAQFVAALTSGDGAAELVRDEKYSGRASVKVGNGQRFIEHLPGVEANIRKQPKGPNEFRYLRFAWKKRGGKEVLLQLHYPNNWLRYSAGPYQGNGFAESLRVTKELPADFVEVTRDLAADFGEFTLTGLGLTPVDGDCAWFDHIYLARTLEDFDRIPTTRAAPPQAAAGKHGGPRTLGDLVAGDGPLSPPPDEAAEKKARQEIRKTFGADLAAAKKPDEKRKLAERFIHVAGETRDDSPSLYVLLREAADLGEAAGDLDLAWQAVDELAQSHVVDAIALKQQSLAEIGKGAKSPQQTHEMADAACRLLADALAAGQPAAAKKIAAQAQSFAKRAKDAALVKEIGVRTRNAGKWAAEFEQASAARETLKTKPDDPKANFTLGRYELCAAGDWKQALPKLAKGGDANWQKLAKEELELTSGPAMAERQLAAGDGWWDLAQKESWPGRHYLRMRAAERYRGARPSPAGKDKARVDERLRALLAEDDGLPAWELFGIRGEHNRGSYVRLPHGVGLRTPIDYDGPIEVAFEARTDGVNIRLYAHGNEAVVWNWEANPAEMLVRRPTGAQTTVKAAPLEADRWYALRYVVTPQGMTISVDGAVVFTEAGDYRGAPRSHVMVHGWQDSIVDVRKLVVKPLD